MCGLLQNRRGEYLTQVKQGRRNLLFYFPYKTNLLTVLGLLLLLSLLYTFYCSKQTDIKKLEVTEKAETEGKDGKEDEETEGRYTGEYGGGGGLKIQKMPSVASYRWFMDGQVMAKCLHHPPPPPPKQLRKLE